MHRSPLFRSALVGLAALLSVTAALAQTAPVPAPRPEVPADPAVTTATFGDWLLRCVRQPAPAGEAGQKSDRLTAQTCEVVQTIKVQGQAQPIAQLAIGRLPDSEQLIMTAVLPVNISLPGQVGVIVDPKAPADGAIILEWRRCAGGSCFADTRPDDGSLRPLRAGEAGQIRFADAGGRIISVPVSWRGLDQALAALEKQS
ncbi:invasion protein [Aquibium carbonis]|uniref:Invasion protein n=1 Tax=Aquibium carbonis TaxID=2495581 RepID=A0A3S0AV78_9HYPH|nr:invasion associated locus B family protein [Aquibium carbonis]RST87917.1 invasion protein [Aquibium carbonis]